MKVFLDVFTELNLRTMSIERTLKHIWSSGCVPWNVRMIAINWLSRLCSNVSQWTEEVDELMDQCRRHCPCKNKYKLFQNSASPKRKLACCSWKNFLLYCILQYCLILPWTKEKSLERESMFRHWFYLYSGWRSCEYLWDLKWKWIA